MSYSVRSGYIYHHHDVPLAWIFLILPRHSFLLSITSGRSSRLHPVSVQNCCKYVLAGRPTLPHSCDGVHKSTLFMSSPLLLQQCPACLVHLIWMVSEISGRWPYSCCFVVCCHQDLFHRACSSQLVSVLVVHPYNSTDTTAFAILWIKIVKYQ